MRTVELSGAALDWAVAKCEFPEIVWGKTVGLSAHARDLIVIPDRKEPDCYWQPSTNWAQGGPIIEREKISLVRCDDELVFNAERVHVRVPKWFAEHGGGHSRQSQYESENYSPQYEIEESAGFYGETPLEAAMRCYVASKLGDEVQLPEELA